VFTEPIEKFSFQLRSIWTQLSHTGTLSGGRRLTGYGQRLVIRRPPTWLFWALVVAALMMGVFYEVQTSALQSRVFSYLSRRMTYTVQPGASSTIVFPTGGPLNERRGYSRIPQFQERLESQGFSVAEQARFSKYLSYVAKWGVTPPFRLPADAGLKIKSTDGVLLHHPAGVEQLFEGFDEIPPLVMEALLLIENRQLAVESAYPTNNPVVEWDRLAKASLTYVGSKLGLPVRLEGGSTLATQLEKYNFSKNGRTDSPSEKLRQIFSASLRAYKDGANTVNARRNILTDYLNSMPLAAAPGFGEVNGLGQGLQAWFGKDFGETMALLREQHDSPEKAAAFKHVLTLLASLRAPSYYLTEDRAALEQRVRFYARLLAEFGMISPYFSQLVQDAEVNFLPRAGLSAKGFDPRQKLSAALRKDLGSLLGVSDFYTLNRLDLEARASVDATLQESVDRLFAHLSDPEFLRENGFIQNRLLLSGDPEKVIYSMILYERTPQGNVLRVQTDNLARPLDVNEGIKLELGSTAKLRTLAHYLEIVASLYYERHSLSDPKDPITRFVYEAYQRNPQLSLEDLLQQALDREYSASPGEVFFTGGGVHTFSNFDADDNGRRMSVREATRRSTNLVFIRLMRDLVRYHEARLPYDADEILSDPENPTRKRMLQEIADAESRQVLLRAFNDFQGKDKAGIVSALLGSRAKSSRHLAILFFAWNGTSHRDTLKAISDWLHDFGVPPKPNEDEKLTEAYGNPNLNLADYGYLLDIHPLRVFAAGEMIRQPEISSEELLARSRPAIDISSSWLFRPRNRRAQDLRLKIRIEQDAFTRMTPYWRRLGFPFERLVPSYATAIGNSSDRPAALAELMGIILNDGQARPTFRFHELRFARGTPYQTVVVPSTSESRQVMVPAVARALREVLAEVVDGGTARRVSGVFKDMNGKKITVGGKTGSGDNRIKSFSRGGGLLSSRAVSRTATFTFYIGDRYFGVITASVLGPEADDYRFTSALPVEILKKLAPAITARFDDVADS